MIARERARYRVIHTPAILEAATAAAAVTKRVYDQHLYKKVVSIVHDVQRDVDRCVYTVVFCSLTPTKIQQKQITKKHTRNIQEHTHKIHRRKRTAIKMPVRKYRRRTTEISCCLKYFIFSVNVLFWVREN